MVAMSASWSMTGKPLAKALDAAGVVPIGGPFLDFRDPWGNRIEIVGYDNVQFTKAPNVLRGMGLTHLAKNERAKKELAEKGMALGQG
jgi:lactoylglutathione lyase